MLKVLKQINYRIMGILNIGFELGWALTFFFDPQVFMDKTSLLHQLICIEFFGITLFIPPFVWGSFLLLLAGFTLLAILQTKYRSQIIHLTLTGLPCFLWSYFALLAFMEYESPVKYTASSAFIALTLANIIEILTIRHCKKIIVRSENE